MRAASILSIFLAAWTVLGVPTVGWAELAPRLVVVLSIDQLRRDRVGASLPGGLGRLHREGRVYENALLDHAASETCPGHAVMATGRQPGPSGVPANVYFDRELRRQVYCVEDTAADATVIGLVNPAPPGGRSPRKLRVNALGDWIKEVSPASKVFSVSGKDRAAIAMGGRRPDAAYWLLGSGALGFTTSQYYLKELPEWALAWRGEGAGASDFLSEIPDTWTHLASPPGSKRPDSYAAESAAYRSSSGHPLRDSNPEVFLARVIHSPFEDDLTLSFAKELILQEGLGDDDAPDLLTLSLSATDRVGHLYGPESAEAYDALQRLDAGLAGFLEFLESRVEKGRLWVTLTADHGVLALPEWLVETGRNECPAAGGRLITAPLFDSVLRELHQTLEPTSSTPQQWFDHSKLQLYVNRSLAEEHGVEVERVIAVAEAALEKRRVIEQVWTAAEIRSGTSAMAELYRNSFDPERSGDLVIQLAPGCLVGKRTHGTTHGSPYPYDREVPLVFWGTGIEAETRAGTARTVDIAPTVAELLGVPTPEGLDGRSLLR